MSEIDDMLRVVVDAAQRLKDAIEIVECAGYQVSVNIHDQTGVMYQTSKEPWRVWLTRTNGGTTE